VQCVPDGTRFALLITYIGGLFVRFNDTDSLKEQRYGYYNSKKRRQQTCPGRQKNRETRRGRNPASGGGPRRKSRGKHEKRWPGNPGAGKRMTRLWPGAPG